MMDDLSISFLDSDEVENIIANEGLKIEDTYTFSNHKQLPASEVQSVPTESEDKYFTPSAALYQASNSQPDIFSSKSLKHVKTSRFSEEESSLSQSTQHSDPLEESNEYPQNSPSQSQTQQSETGEIDSSSECEFDGSNQTQLSYLQPKPSQFPQANIEILVCCVVCPQLLYIVMYPYVCSNLRADFSINIYHFIILFIL